MEKYTPRVRENLSEVRILLQTLSTRALLSKRCSRSLLVNHSWVCYKTINIVTLILLQGVFMRNMLAGGSLVSFLENILGHTKREPSQGCMRYHGFILQSWIILDVIILLFLSKIVS